MLAFMLGPRSLLNLRGVHPDLVSVVSHAIEVTTVDFTVLEGRRTEKRQRQLVASGASRTMHSRHLTGHAVDIAPYVGGKIRWDWPLYYPLAEAMRVAANELGILIRWGGCWDVLTGTGADPEDLVARYIAAQRAQGKSAFTDGPHFELPRERFP